MKENNQLPVIFDHGYFLKTGENFVGEHFPKQLLVVKETRVFFRLSKSTDTFYFKTKFACNFLAHAISLIHSQCNSSF